MLCNFALPRTCVRAGQTLDFLLSTRGAKNFPRRDFPSLSYRTCAKKTHHAVMTSSFASFSTTNSDQKNEHKTIKELITENVALRKEVEELKKKSKAKPGKFFTLIKEYGLPFVAYWTGWYAISGAGIYFAIENGWLAGTDAIQLIQTIGLDRYVDIENLNPSHGNIAFAFLLNEIVETIRFPFVLATFPAFKNKFLTKREDDL